MDGRKNFERKNFGRTDGRPSPKKRRKKKERKKNAVPNLEAEGPSILADKVNNKLLFFNIFDYSQGVYYSLGRVMVHNKRHRSTDLWIHGSAAGAAARAAAGAAAGAAASAATVCTYYVIIGGALRAPLYGTW